MRILANRTHKYNGDSYSVTFETMGDVPLDQVDQTVDDLFTKAQKAIERQIEEKAMKFPQEEKGDMVSLEGPATEKQIAFLRKLKAEEKKGIPIDSLTKEDASQLIKKLMEIS